MDDLSLLLGKTKPIKYNCLIAVGFDGGCILIKSDNGIEDAFDGSDLYHNLTSTEDIPKIPGIYECVISYHSFRCNNFDDPEEWDVNCFIESSKLINRD